MSRKDRNLLQVAQADPKRQKHPQMPRMPRLIFNACSAFKQLVPTVRARQTKSQYSGPLSHEKNPGLIDVERNITLWHDSFTNF